MRPEKDVLKYSLGISAFYHDSSVTILDSAWKVVFASLEERFSKVKHDSSFPKLSLLYWLKSLGITLADIDAIWFYEKPFLRFFLSLQAISLFYPHSYSYFYNFIRKFFLQYMSFSLFLKRHGFIGEINYLEHHMSHASYTYFTSWYDQSGVLVVDGVWDNSTISFYMGGWVSLTLKEEIKFPHSVWLLYSLFTVFIGFEPNEWEYKMMWLAPYGKPKYVDKIRKLILKDTKGSFELDISYLNFTSFTSPFTAKFIQEFWFPREAHQEITQYHKDIAASIQAYLEYFITTYLTYLKEKYSFDRLCFSWGVALNCKLNGLIYENRLFKDIYIPPNPGDAGSSMGAVLFWSKDKLVAKKYDINSIAYLGYDIEDESESHLRSCLQSLFYKKYEATDITLFEHLVKALSENKVIAVCQWKAEFWPRALGNRSILASALHPEIKETLNMIKGREYFRPFAPIVMKDDFEKYFKGNNDSAYMMHLSDVVSQGIPWVTHHDNTARVQTVSPGTNDFIELLLRYWGEHSWVWVLVNTSFNIAWEVIVNDIQDAVSTFKRTNISYLVIKHKGSYYLVSKD